MKSRPIIRRSFYFDYFPQVPNWIPTYSHIAARLQFRKKIKRNYQFEHLKTCPLCTGTRFQLVANQERHGIPIFVVICLDCSLVFNNPRLTENSMFDHYDTEARAVERGSRDDIHEFMFDLQKKKGPFFQAFFAREKVVQHLNGRRIKTVAEVGCGEGGLLAAIRDQYDTAVGFELNRSAVEYGRKKGLNIIPSRLSPKPELPYYDLIIYEQVFEHIFDPNAELQLLASMQRTGDLLYLSAPGLKWFPKHYKGNFLAYLEYQHCFHFTLFTLEKLLAKHGYRLVDGTAEIQALFVRVKDSNYSPLKTAPESSQEIIEFLLEEEKKYRSRPTGLLRTHFHYVLRSILYAMGLTKCEDYFFVLKRFIKNLINWKT